MKKEKLVTCSKCGNIYNKKIKYCPNCDEINKNLLIGKIVKLIILLFILVGLIYYYNINYNNKNEKLIIDNNELFDNNESFDNNDEYNLIDFIDENGNIYENTTDLNSIDRSNSKAEEIKINSGSYIVGENIKNGRYICASIDTPTVVIVYDEKGQQIFYELVGKTESNYGTKTLTIDLNEGYTVEISDGEVTLLPIETSIKDTLSTGNWYVGIDIKPGVYNVECKEGDGSIIFIDNKNNILSVIDSVKSNFTTQLELVEGQQIRLYTIDELKFTLVE